MKKRFVSNTILLLVLVILTSSQCFAQITYEIDKTTRFEKIGVEEGMSSEWMTCLHQDKYGFIWIGTQIGLNMYDGYEFEVFTRNPKNHQSINDEYINNIFEEPDGTMWFCTDIGFSKYNRSNHTFTNFTPDNLTDFRHNNLKIVQNDNDFWIGAWNDLYRFNKEKEEFTSFAKDSLNPQRGIMGSGSSCIFMDKTGVLWVGSNDHEGKFYLSKFIKETGKFVHYQNDLADPQSFVGKEVQSMAEDLDGNIWVATDGGGLLKIIDKENGKFRRYTHTDTDKNSIIHNKLYSVFEDSKGNMWFGGTTGFSLLDKKTNQFINYQIPHQTANANWPNIIGEICEDNHGKLWMVARQGVFRFNPSTQKLIHYLHDPDNPAGLASNNARKLIIDNSGQVWVILYNHGLNRINPFSNAFRKIDEISNLDKSISVVSMTGFYVDSRGYLWISCSDGLHRTKANKKKIFTDFEHFGYNSNDSTSLSSTAIFSRYEDQDQNLWFGTWDGLNKYDYNTNSFVRYYHDPEDDSSITPGTAKGILEDSYGTLWFGNINGGLNILNKESGKFIRFQQDENDPSSISSPSVRVIFEDSHGELWIAGSYLDRLKRSDTSFIHYLPNISGKKDDAPSSIWDIVEDDSANLWMQTMRRGIYKWNRRDSTFSVLSTENGLSCNFIKTLEVDNNGDIWATSSHGLSRINSDNHQIKNFDVADGLVNLELTNSYKDPDGWLYVVGRDGFNVFHPDSIKENKFIPPVYLTSLDVSGQQKYFEKPLFEISQIELKHNENDLNIDYVALNYVNSKKNNYAFMLEGYDEDWKYVDSRRTAYYTNLSPGAYTFRVKGSNNDGYWNETGASLDIFIHPPFWATWWAYFLYLTLFIYVIYIIFRFYLRRQQLLHDLELKQVESEKLKELDHLKSRFFNNISHEFRTPLTLVLGPLEKLLLKTKDSSDKKELTIAKKYAGRLQTMINHLLSLSKLESGKMQLHASETNVIKLVSGYLQAYESLATQKNIKLMFSADVKEINIYLDKEKFEQILNNLLSNAFKFTESGREIVVSISSPQSAVHSRQINISKQMTEDRRLQTEDWVSIQISDTGRGIPADKLARIFDRFYQVEHSDMNYHEGTGIGLALTKELVELHHGLISVESTVGKGSMFSVTLPTGKQHLSPTEIDVGKNDEVPAAAHSVNLPIVDIHNSSDFENNIVNADSQSIMLIVEDNADMREYIRSYFESGFHIIEAVDGIDGFEKSLAHIPDIIISDVMMPNMDGNAFCTKVKKDVRTSHIPVILLTARASKENRIEGLETGADDFITKPFDGDEIQVRVENLIHQRRKLQEHYLKNIEATDETLSLEEKFLQKATNIATENLSNPAYSVEDFASDMALSRNQLHRKLRALVNNSCTEFIRTIRLNRAVELLRKRSGNISEIAYDTGFNNPTYFSIAFKEKFGMSPSDYQKNA